MVAPPKGLLFDLDNTLIDRDAAFVSWLAAAGFDDAAIEKAVRLDRHGAAPRAPLCEYLAERLREPTPEVEARLSERVADYVTVDADRLALIERLASSFSVGVVTNGGGAGQRKKLANAGLADVFGERVVVSGVLGVKKPGPAIFVAALDAIGCRAAETVFVGDDLDNDIVGARSVGMRTIWVSHGRSAPATRVDLVIESLERIEEVLPT